jgi:YidC/Oxa1 family membrane protein insertase
MFNTFIVEPLFNALVIIYALIPGHNFGLAIIVFTVLVRLLMWPLVKKQLRHTVAMRRLQPDLKRIKKEADGDRQKEGLLVMQLYKDKGVSPFSSIGVIIVQLIVFIGLYRVILNIVDGPQAIFDNAYSWVANIGWLQNLSTDLSQFDATLFGAVDLTKSALSTEGLYIPALIIVLGSSLVQFFQTKQLMPVSKESKSIKQIMNEAKEGKKADPAEMNESISKGMKYFLPGLIFFVTVYLPSALGLYWLVSGFVGYWQQAVVLGHDDMKIEPVSEDSKAKREVIEGEVITPVKSTPKKKSKSSKKSSKKKKRKKK